MQCFLGKRLVRYFSSSISADYVIIGAGVMGLNTAYQLRKRDSNANIEETIKQFQQQ